jgi:hypothetical protein
LLDPHGYYELVIHPPPINVFTLAILPCIIRKSIMRKASECFSKFIFWVENSLYIGGFFLYEMILCPYIYFKVVINVIRLSTWYLLIPMLVFWIIVGPFFLLFAVCKDMFFYIKIMCDYCDEED